MPRVASKTDLVAPAFIASTAVVMGDVTLADESSVWYGAVLRADGFVERLGSGRIHGEVHGAVEAELQEAPAEIEPV